MLTERQRKLTPTPVEKLREKWEHRWAPMYVRMVRDVKAGRGEPGIVLKVLPEAILLKAGELYPCEWEETARHVAFYVRVNGRRFEVAPGEFVVELWVYRG